MKTLLRACLLGASFFTVMAAEVSGLQTTSASTTAFLENLAIVFVPVFEGLLLKRLPQGKIMVSALLSLSGVALLTLKGGMLSLSVGELFCFFAALSYAGSIILTDRLSKKDDPLVLGVLQVGFMGLFSMIAAFIFETPRLPSYLTEWYIIIALAIICTGFGFTLQPLAQRHTSTERAGLFCAISPLSTSVLAYIFLGEGIQLTGLVGILLILFAFLFMNLNQPLNKEANINETHRIEKIFETKRL